MAKFCPNCGTEVKHEEKFCPSCGIKITTDSSNAEVDTSAERYEEDHEAFDIIFKTTGRLGSVKQIV